MEIQLRLKDKCTSGSYCRPDSSKCFSPNLNSATLPATCVPYVNQCSSDIECNTSTEYCYGGRCTPYANEGECCGLGIRHRTTSVLSTGDCRGNSKCAFLYSAEDLNREDFLPRPPRICRPPCTSDADCVAEVEICGPPSANGLSYCQCNTAVCYKDSLARKKFRHKYPNQD